ncbi:MAG: DUF6468 domain-containing protein [Paracoccaceae bacterium]
MTVLSDLLLASAALGAAIYCFVLSRRLAALSALDGGLGSAIAVLSGQVDALTKSLAAARNSAGTAGSSLAEQTRRAETVARKLELLVASMHDLNDSPEAPPPSRWPPEGGDRATAQPMTTAEPAPRSRVLRRRPQAMGDA